MRKVLILVVLLAAVLVAGQNANAATKWVSPNALGPAPGTSCNNAGYATIQAAINAANAGDTVKVCPGTYVENIAINKASLTVSSTGGAAVTIVKAAVINSVVTVTGSKATLVGFTLVPAGSVAKYDIGVNVAIKGNASTEIANNYIRGGRIGVNLGCASSGSTVYHNNVRGATETGINIDTCETAALPGSTFNSVHHNSCVRRPLSVFDCWRSRIRLQQRPSQHGEVDHHVRRREHRAQQHRSTVQYRPREPR